MPDTGAQTRSLTDETRIAEKVIQLGLVFECLSREVWSRKGVDGLFLNPAVARGVAVSYLHDIDRMKDYHDFGLVDQAKQACYWIKWIIREKPIQFDVPVEQVVLEHRLANEKMAFHMACACLRISPRIISASFARLLIYTFHFRRVDEDSLLPLCDLLSRLSRAVNPEDGRVALPL